MTSQRSISAPQTWLDRRGKRRGVAINAARGAEGAWFYIWSPLISSTLIVLADILFCCGDCLRVNFLPSVSSVEELLFCLSFESMRCRALLLATVASICTGAGAGAGAVLLSRRKLRSGSRVKLIFMSTDPGESVGWFRLAPASASLLVTLLLSNSVSSCRTLARATASRCLSLSALSKSDWLLLIFERISASTLFLVSTSISRTSRRRVLIASSAKCRSSVSLRRSSFSSASLAHARRASCFAVSACFFATSASDCAFQSGLGLGLGVG